METFYQQKPILGIVGRAAGILSLMGASVMIYDIGRNAEKRSKPKDRIVLCMSICDFLFCFSGPVLGFLMVPSEDYPGAVGNQTTCNIQGFMYTGGAAASSSYNASLAIIYLLIVKYDWSDERLSRVEPYFHIYPILHGMLYLAAIPLQAYNMGDIACLLIESPIYCWLDDSCTRGGKALFIVYFAMIVLFLQFLVIVTCMVSLYKAVFNRESAGNQFRFNPDNLRPARRGLSRSMKIQGIWYSASYLLWCLPLGIQTLFFEIPFGNAPLAMKIISSFTTHFLGISNAIVYLRPRYLKLLQENPTLGRLEVLRMTLHDQRPSAAQRRTSLILLSSPSNTANSSTPRHAGLNCSLTLKAPLECCAARYHNNCCNKRKNALQETENDPPLDQEEQAPEEETVM